MYYIFFYESSIFDLSVWVMLLDLPIHFFPECALHSIVARLGKFLKRDNPTTCVSRLAIARVCIELDVSKPPFKSICIRMPKVSGSHFQEMFYEKYTPFCVKYCNL